MKIDQILLERTLGWMPTACCTVYMQTNLALRNSLKSSESVTAMFSTLRENSWLHMEAWYYKYLDYWTIVIIKHCSIYEGLCIPHSMSTYSSRHRGGGV